jgi:AraC-like DNA-binding protein
MKPNNIINRPDGVDPIEDALHRSKPRAGSIATVLGRGPWRLRFPPPSGAKFNYLSEGSCIVWSDEAAPIHVSAGDAFLLTRPTAFVIATDDTAVEQAASPLFAQHGGRHADVGAPDAPVTGRLLGGSFSFDGATKRLLLEGLPPLVHVPATNPHARAIASRLVEMDNEMRSRRLGARSVAESLANVLLVELLRFLKDDDTIGHGLIAGMRDEVSAAALRAIHTEPAAPWTVESLAHRAAVSRSTLAVRFKASTGLSPLTYLTRWRVDLAAEQLLTTRRTIASIAEDVGYGSEAAFALAFKRETGYAPGQYRRTAVSAQSSQPRQDPAQSATEPDARLTVR